MEPTWNSKRSVKILLALAAIASPGLFFGTASAAPYYEGKTITYLIGFPAGGSVDLVVRMNAEHMSKHIPGNPTIVVKSMPGARGIKAGNFIINKARRDGLTIYNQPWFWTGEVVGSKGQRFKWGDFTLISAFRTAGTLVYIRKDSVPGGFKKSTDIMKAPNLRYGGSGPTTGRDLMVRLSLDLLGVRYNYIPGYRGGPRVRPAVLKGELNMGADSPSAYAVAIKPTMEASGTVVPLWTWWSLDASGNMARNPHLPQWPVYTDVYKAVKGGTPSGLAWEALKLAIRNNEVNTLTLAPPGIPAEARDALRKGFATMARDKVYQATNNKRFGYVPEYVDIEEAAGRLKGLSTLDPKLVAFLKDHVAKGEKGRRK